MNERIKDLIAQATSKPHRDQGFGGEPTHTYPGTLDPEKLAELIIMECAGVTLDYKNDSYYEGWCDHAEEILKRFGLE